MYHHVSACIHMDQQVATCSNNVYASTCVIIHSPPPLPRPRPRPPPWNPPPPPPTTSPSPVGRPPDREQRQFKRYQYIILPSTEQVRHRTYFRCRSGHVFPTHHLPTKKQRNKETKKQKRHQNENRGVEEPTTKNPQKQKPH